MARPEELPALIEEYFDDQRSSVKKFIESANKTAKDRIEQANIEIESAKRESLENIRKEIIDVAMLAAQKVVEREIDTKDNKKFLDQFVKEVTHE